ncbi:unnamed protein product [Lampetra planeri]
MSTDSIALVQGLLCAPTETIENLCEFVHSGPPRSDFVPLSLHLEEREIENKVLSSQIISTFGYISFHAVLEAQGHQEGITDEYHLQ